MSDSSSFTIHAEGVLTPEGLRPAAVRISGERVAAVTPCAAPPPGAERVEGVLMPALVDSHVHVNEPGRTEWEGFFTATRAAAKGGVAVLADMPLNSLPVTTTRAALEEKIAATEGKLYVDVALWGGLVPHNVDELPDLVHGGVAGVKAFLCHSGIDEFPAVDRADLLRAMPVLRGLGVPLLFHAELEGEIPPGLEATSVREYIRWLHARPREWEDRAIALVIEVVEATGCPAHIVHLSSASALPMIEAAKQRGLPITVETCPHYLCLSAEEVPAGATEYKCAPPIRERENREGLWRGLAAGIIDAVVTDHSPCVPALKHRDAGDFEAAWGGIASLQLGLANVWTEARRRGFGLDALSRWMSRAPARLLGLGLGGVIEVGARADLVAWRPDASFTVEASELLHRHPLTPYLGAELSGVVDRTWLRGQVIYAGGHPSERLRGRLLLKRTHG